MRAFLSALFALISTGWAEPMTNEEMRTLQAVVVPVLRAANLDPMPRVVIASSSHPRLRPARANGLTGEAIDRLGRADITETGAHILYLSRSLLDDEAALREASIHEAAHFLAWQRHGYRIKEHGSKFNRALRDIRRNLNDT